MTTLQNAIDLLTVELEKAVAKHPSWPTDKIHAVAIMVEEAGESMQAAIDATYAPGAPGEDYLKLRTELAQTGAMCLRAIMNLDNAQPADGEWIPWHGGAQPVPDGTKVNWRCVYQDGHYGYEDNIRRLAEGLNWNASGEARIVAYRVARQ